MKRTSIFFLVLFTLVLAGCRSTDVNLEIEPEETEYCEECQVPTLTNTPRKETIEPTPTPEASNNLISPLSPLPTPSGLDSPLSPLPTPVIPEPTRNVVATATPKAMTSNGNMFILLHTNDTWGYYAPCG